MKHLVTQAGRRLRTADGPDPEAGPTDLLLDVAYCGVCGSDLHFLQQGELPDGTVLGHELSGTVRRTGSAVTGFQVGDRVAVNPLLACADCRHCDTGRPHLCRTGLHRGIGLGITPGGFAEQVVVPADRAVRVPAGLDLRQAALTEPLAVGVHAARLAAAEDAPVLVRGAGPIGVLAALALQARATVPVLITSANPARAAIATDLGLTVTTAEDVSAGRVAEFEGRPPRVILEATGRNTALSAGADLIDAGGLIVLVGGTHEPSTVSTQSLVLKEIRVMPSFAYTQQDIVEAVRLLASGAVRVEPLITGEYPLAQAPAAIDAMAARTPGQMKVLVAPGL